MWGALQCAFNRVRLEAALSLMSEPDGKIATIMLTV